MSKKRYTDVQIKELKANKYDIFQYWVNEI
jgi:hypothetical protein